MENKLDTLVRDLTTVTGTPLAKSEVRRRIAEYGNDQYALGIVAALNCIPVGDEYREIRHKIKEKYLDHHNGTSD